MPRNTISKSALTRSGAKIDGSERECDCTDGEVPNVRRSKTGSGRPGRTLSTAEGVRPGHAKLLEGSTKPEWRRSGTRTGDSNLAEVSTGRAASSQAMDLKAETTSGVAKSIASENKPNLAALKANRASPGLVCPREDAAEPSVKKSGTNVRGPDQALPDTGSMKPEQPRLWSKRERSIRAKSSAAAENSA